MHVCWGENVDSIENRHILINAYLRRIGKGKVFSVLTKRNVTDMRITGVIPGAFYQEMLPYCILLSVMSMSG